ncbi:MAG TPA: helix-turn-helix domain-containing protein [Rhizomicrobium sp.]|nr:helix-turn-helix domain-containing protein [Rhizomicrobium sp.]
MTKLTQLSLDGEGGRRRLHLREISGDSETPLETVGQDLRTARLRRGEDLATVSRALKIRKEHLEAVEEDRIESLPGRTYAIGFVRSYANYLGLDTTAMVERFKEEISGRHNDQASAMAPIPDEETRHLPRGWRIVTGVVVLLLGYGAWHLFFSGSMQVAVPPPPSLNPPKVAAKAAPPKPAPQPTQTASATPAAPAVSTTRPAKAPAVAPTANMSSVPAQASAQPAAPPKPSPADTAVSTIGTTGGTVYGELNRNPRVVLKVKSDTRVTVRGEDGSLYLNRELKAGDSYMVPNLPGLYLATSNAGAIEVDLDGQALGQVGQSQEILGRVSLDPQSLVDRFNAH